MRRTGEGLGPPIPCDLRIYEVREHHGEIELKLPDLVLSNHCPYLPSNFFFTPSEDKINPSPTVRELPKITVHSDTRDVLAHAVRQQLPPTSCVIVDVDAHVTEVAFWNEITDLIDNDVLRHLAKSVSEKQGVTGLLNTQPGLVFQDVGGRIPHQHSQREENRSGCTARSRWCVERWTRWAIDYTVVFPTPDADAGHAPDRRGGGPARRRLQPLARPTGSSRRSRASRRWCYLPFNDPEAACIRRWRSSATSPA